MKTIKYFLFVIVLFPVYKLDAQDVTSSTLHSNQSTFRNIISSKQREDETDLFKINLKDTLNLGFDLMMRPEDIDAGNYVAIGGIGTYQSYLWGANDDGSVSAFRGMFDLNLKIQAPSTGKDTTTTLNRIYSSGSVGSFYGVFKTGFLSKDNSKGIYLSLSPILNWQDSKVLEDTTTNNFGYFSIRSSISAWAGPFIINAALEYYKVFGSPDENVIATKLNKSLNLRLNAAVVIDNGYYAQFRYAFPLDNTDGNSGLLEISLTKTLSFK